MSVPIPKVVDFRQEQEGLRNTLRQGMLDAATRLLVEEGAAALTVRKVAEAVNCSTTLLYSIFGGKDGLSNALYLEGFARLKQEYAAYAAGLPEPQPADSVDGIWNYANIYHGYARGNPSYYMVMFGDAIAGFVPPLESRVAAWESFTPLIAQFERCMQDGSLPPSSPTAAARLLWAAMHGVISLELKGYYLKKEHPDELYKAAIRAVLCSLRNPAPKE
ncbi:TetR/AcrR family transcriptional regulator [Undibacterium sp.]|jgi:AcrR family transcriptional regulator|uniref:TetR/AcrR family transcriptional regulator n=1 Tax=Undibacterium sp. TaxID=1914977 RepID=UPI002CEC1427|nr:TetR/AcrR family transcriptional regulator [Undibacterium sp.]HTD04120.1 TetR/AcrR family transcriptional regulator [Undibacterium sp.]